MLKALHKSLSIVTAFIVVFLLHKAPAFGQNMQQDTVYVYFDFDKSFLTDAGKKSIDSVLSRIIQTAFLKGITLTGHCDSIGNNPYNDSLSITRVSTVRQYLYTRGATDRIITEIRGYGKRQPRVENSSDENRSLNRRVELIVSSLPNPKFKKETPPPAPVAEVTAPKPPPAPPRPDPRSIKEFVRDTASKVGDNLVLKNLHFIGGRHFPINISFPVLDELLLAMRENPTLRIAIEGHICCEKDGIDAVDTDTGTRDLSVRRAKFVYDYLKGYGVGGDRMEYRGFGSSQKLFVNETSEAQQQANRRVEIKIIGK